jgi:tetratricopeptide (TPR) repeat protein/tRNA A-37 threonylcarbamoyl transferase component Bud32
MSDDELVENMLREEFGSNGEAERRALFEAFAADDDDLPTPSAIARAFETPTQAFTPPIGEVGKIVGGRYKLQELLAEGGMGSVWVADQFDPVRRRVAVKLIKPGMDSRQVVARFEAERQALALMDHPNIARVFDGGLIESGHPYFAMELVNGLPIAKFCDEAGLDVRERLELFVQVCNAVQHAHQKGIVHRDLKPSNVLVTMIDGRPTPKVIDFGVAKALGGRLTDASDQTRFGAVVGTLEYMAPEQAAYSGTDVDTRADVYALGVLLYELLTGLHPFGSERLRKAAMDEVIRILHEEQPSRPSTKLGTSESLTSAAAVRRVDPNRLLGSLRGELDWITLKCLEKDRNRRYESASGLAADVRRHLANEPVQAMPPSAGYRLMEFIRRNRRGVIAAGVVFVGLLLGATGLAWGYFRAEANRTLAEQRLAQITKSLNLFASIVKDIDPRSESGLGPSLYEQLRERVHRAADELELETVGDRPTLARLQLLLGETLVGLGSDQKAAQILERARDGFEDEFGTLHPETLAAVHSLAASYRGVGRLDEAIQLFSRVRDKRTESLGADHPETLRTMNSLAVTLNRAGRTAEAIELYESMREPLAKKVGPDDPLALAALANLAASYHKTRRHAEAVALYEQVFKAQSSVLGPHHQSTFRTQSHLAAAHRATGNWAEAIRHYEDVRGAMTAKFPDDSETYIAVNNLGVAYYSNGQSDRAVPLFEELLDRSIERRGRTHHQTLAVMINLAANYVEVGRIEDAQPLVEEVLDGPFDPARYRIVAPILVRIHAESGKRAEAVALAKKVAMEVRRRSSRIGPEFSELLGVLGGHLIVAKAYADAESLLREALAEAGSGGWNKHSIEANLGAALVGRRKSAEAETLLLKGFEGMKANESKAPPRKRRRLGETVEALVELYASTSKPELAEKWRMEAAALNAKRP